MIKKAQDLRKVFVDFEPESGPPPPPTGPPRPGPDENWDETPVPGGGGDDNDDDGKPGDFGDGPLNSPIIKDDSNSNDEKDWREDIQRARQRDTGSIPGALKGILDDMFSKPVIDWKILLKKFVNKMAAKVEYFMPNKRFIGDGDFLWGSKKIKNGFETLFLVADTSGSIGKNELESFVAQAINIMKEFKPKETYLIWCDTKVYEPVDVLKGPNDLWKMREAKGTGGGDFRPPFIWIEKNILGKKKIGPIIYFTDGYEQFPKLGDYGTDKYHKNVFWLIVSPRTPNNNIKIPFGTKIDLVTNV